ncbi:hypothetical protein CKAN_01766600 [Cinnamomum micranthum f. kanehirae]|uniref:LRR receptor-like serine/threonine-protein kinase n=1 Tax=Cinnamomum micranthum f. kanehirae TaxID=337451 RepID=A0A443PCZ9_9MAGN|nr:hypothetical protein CKAN_01766600 [Cinnamomum micranthum f. kanehirae]
MATRPNFSRWIITNLEICAKKRVYGLDARGPIPEELGNLTKLFDLNLLQNYLTGPLPAFIGNLTDMKYLSFGKNALSGPIPKEIGKLQKLISLYDSMFLINSS